MKDTSEDKFANIDGLKELQDKYENEELMTRTRETSDRPSIEEAEEHGLDALVEEDQSQSEQEACQRDRRGSDR
jgi:hypothetical protein